MFENKLMIEHNDFVFVLDISPDEGEITEKKIAEYLSQSIQKMKIVLARKYVMFMLCLLLISLPVIHMLHTTLPYYLSTEGIFNEDYAKLCVFGWSAITAAVCMPAVKVWTMIREVKEDMFCIRRFREDVLEGRVELIEEEQQ